MARRALSGSLSATAIASATGRREPAPSSCASRVAQRQLLSRLPRTAPAGGEGAHRRHPEAYIQGISTRSVDDLVKALGMSGTSKSQVSRLCQEIDERVMAFLDRPIEGDWPYLWVDATYVKVRSNGRIVPVAVIVAVGVNGDGR